MLQKSLLLLHIIIILTIFSDDNDIASDVLSSIAGLPIGVVVINSLSFIIMIVISCVACCGTCCNSNANVSNKQILNVLEN